VAGAAGSMPPVGSIPSHSVGATTRRDTRTRPGSPSRRLHRSTGAVRTDVPEPRTCCERWPSCTAISSATKGEPPADPLARGAAVGLPFISDRTDAWCEAALELPFRTSARTISQSSPTPPSSVTVHGVERTAALVAMGCGRGLPPNGGSCRSRTVAGTGVVQSPAQVAVWVSHHPGSVKLASSVMGNAGIGEHVHAGVYCRRYVGHENARSRPQLRRHRRSP
jgi:hypothetical protein